VSTSPVSNLFTFKCVLVSNGELLALGRKFSSNTKEPALSHVTRRSLLNVSERIFRLPGNCLLTSRSDTIIFSGPLLRKLISTRTTVLTFGGTVGACTAPRIFCSLLPQNISSILKLPNLPFASKSNYSLFLSFMRHQIAINLTHILIYVLLTGYLFIS
jgi:hypothetical protein